MRVAAAWQFNAKIQPRLGIHGKSKDEWGRLARWVADNDFSNESGEIKWMVSTFFAYILSY